MHPHHACRVSLTRSRPRLQEREPVWRHACSRSDLLRHRNYGTAVSRQPGLSLSFFLLPPSLSAPLHPTEVKLVSFPKLAIACAQPVASIPPRAVCARVFRLSDGVVYMSNCFSHGRLLAASWPALGHGPHGYNPDSEAHSDRSGIPVGISHCGYLKSGTWLHNL